MVKRTTLKSLNRKIAQVVDNKSLTMREQEMELIKLYKKRARLIVRRRKK